jgi:hypothetical protein
VGKIPSCFDGQFIYPSANAIISDTIVHEKTSVNVEDHKQDIGHHIWLLNSPHLAIAPININSLIKSGYGFRINKRIKKHTAMKSYTR